MNNLWNSGTKKAFYGYVGQLVISLVGGVIVSLSTLSSLAQSINSGKPSLPIGVILVTLVTLGAYVYYFIGLNEMKKAAANTNLQEGTSRLYIGALLGIIATALGFIPMIGIVGSLVGLAGFIVTWLGYSSIKANATNAKAQFGGAKLSSSALFSVIGIVVGLIPVIGWIAALVLEILALVFAIQGWKALAESELA
jgi:hypothetical protein